MAATVAALMRRALSSLQPPSEKSGDPALADLFFRALERAAHESADTLTHPFHSYPARMHPAIANELIAHLPGDICDPFCGSGTVIVEAIAAGRRSCGVDLNPIALRVAETKTRVLDDKQRARFLSRAQQIAERARERTRKKERARAPIDKDSAALFDPHVLVALATVWSEIDGSPNDDDRRSLEAVFSSLLTKLSKRRGDSADHGTTKKLGRFLAADLFEKRAIELASQWEALASAVPHNTPRPSFFLDDARDLDRIIRKVDAIVTSPPYGGTYDYAAHHALRVQWLGLDDVGLRQQEIGARRRASRSRWDDELRDVLRAIAPVLAGTAVLLIGDAEIERERIDARTQVQRLARDVGLTVAASASAPRPDWRGGPPRAEHLIGLRSGSR